MFELAIGCIEAAKEIEGIKFHFFATEADENGHPKPCWEYLFQELKRVGGLGDVMGRVENMEQVFRSMDLTFSPNRIINRCVAESLSCGTPVMTEIGCKVADYDKGIDKNAIIERSRVFNMNNFSKRMNEVYNEVLTNG
jgi:hypothetical protein